MSSIESLPSNHLLDQCAKAWSLSNFTFVRKMENIVYSCDSPHGKVYLRLTTPLRRTRPEIEAEVHWIDHLANSGIKVPRIIPNQKGEEIASFAEGQQHFEAVVFGAVSGEHPSKEIATSPQFLKTLGSLIAKMHLASQSYDAAHHRREKWDEERGLRHALKAAAVSKDTQLRRRFSYAMSWVQELKPTSDNYGLVHIDLGALNLFVDDDDTITIIDFDDSCYHFFAFDLAIVIYSLAGRFDHESFDPKEAEWLEDLLKGYRAVRPLTEEEAAWISKLVDFAILRLYFWIESHELMQTFHKDAKPRIQHVKQWAKKRILSDGVF